MTAKDKAKELVDKFNLLLPRNLMPHDAIVYYAKQCALIAVDELIIQNGELYLIGFCEDYYREKNSYLFEVKSEIEKL